MLNRFSGLLLLALVFAGCGGTTASVRDVDEQGRLWLLENAAEADATSGARPSAIAVLDETTGAPLFGHVLDRPIAAASPNAMVYDDMHGYLYLLDAGAVGEPAFVVYDVLNDTSYRVLSGHTALEPLASDAGIEWSLALSADCRTLYFGVLTADARHAIPTVVLRDRTLADADRSAQIVDGVQP